MIKRTISTDGRFAKLVNLCIQAEGFSDHKLFREMILNHGQESICIFDRGLEKRATFEEFLEKDIHFITCGNDNVRYKIVRIHTKITGVQTETLNTIITFLLFYKQSVVCVTLGSRYENICKLCSRQQILGAYNMHGENGMTPFFILLPSMSLVLCAFLKMPYNQS